MIDGINLEYLGHASFKIISSKIIYIDPFNINGNKDADIILITHEHFDHCSLKDIEKIRKESTIIIAPETCKQKLKNNLKIVKPGEKLNLYNIPIEVVPAYNINKEFHPKGDGLGYIITINKKRIYHAGDTDLIPEMNTIETDIALLPIGGTYTMDEEEAANAANIIKPKIVIPMHYGDIPKGGDPKRFKSKVSPEIEVKIL